MTIKHGDANDEDRLTALLRGHDEDFAIALVDELERPRHPQQRFTVGY